MDARLKAHCEQVGIMIPLRSRPSKINRYMQNPYLPDSPWDSGTIVCYVVERLMWGDSLETGMWSTRVAGKFRAHMASSFHEAILGSQLAS